MDARCGKARIGHREDIVSRPGLAQAHTNIKNQERCHTYA
jgi:hypothetical protein